MIAFGVLRKGLLYKAFGIMALPGHSSVVFFGYDLQFPTTGYNKNYI